MAAVDPEGPITAEMGRLRGEHLGRGYHSTGGLAHVVEYRGPEAQ